MRKEAKKLLEFIEKSPSTYHLVENLRVELQKAGFEALDEKETWKIESGKERAVA